MSRPVLHIAPTPFFANRGCHIRILNEVRSLQRAGRQVIVCTYGLGNDVDGVDVRRIMSIPGYRKTSAGFSPYRFLADFLLFFLVLKTALKERPVVLHGHLHEGGGIGWLVGRLLFWRRMQVVMDVQGSLSGELEAYGHFRRFPFIRRFFYRAERLICRLPDHLFCSSPASRDFLISHCAVSPEKITLLEDVVPDSFFQVPERPLARQKKGIPDGKDVVIYTGSLLAGKGIDLLLPAVAELAVVHPEWFFVFLGYPVEWLQREVAVRGLEQQVHIVGEVPYLELADWLAVADIAVEPKGSGSGEASGKLLHYMAGRLPVVCFDLPNNRKLLGEHGFYAEAVSAQALAQAIEGAFAGRRLWRQMGTKAQEVVIEGYSTGRVARLLASIYRE